MRPRRTFIRLGALMTPPLLVGRAELAARGADIVRALKGEWAGERGMCLCPAHDDDVASLSIRLGDHALLFKCFAGCETIDVLRSIRRLDAAILRLRTTSSDDSAAQEWVRERARSLWKEAVSITGTPAHFYLLARGITRTSAALRFHPRVPLNRRGKLILRPAMLGAIRDPTGVVALQRTFLDLDRGWLANDLGRARRVLARAGTGAVYLARPEQILGIAEGIETALSAMQILGIPVCATLGAERFARIALPPRIERLLLLPDNDLPGVAAEARAMIAYAREGRAIETLWPPVGFKDWNDVLRHGGLPATRMCRASDTLRRLTG